MKCTGSAGRSGIDEARSANTGEGGGLSAVGPTCGAPCTLIARRVRAHGDALKFSAQIEKSEESLRELGFRELRVRHHGELARVEIVRGELQRALSTGYDGCNHFCAFFKRAGYKYVTLDCTGFRFRLNERHPHHLPKCSPDAGRDVSLPSISHLESQRDACCLP